MEMKGDLSNINGGGQFIFSIWHFFPSPLKKNLRGKLKRTRPSDRVKLIESGSRPAAGKTAQLVGENRG